MAGTLFIVATPIGRFDDITLRAIDVLGAVGVVAAEDTRRTGQLLKHFKIQTPLISLHAHNERRRAGDILTRLAGGQSVALVSDAGTPGLSDPGAWVVREARAAGYRVEPVPGPSAITAALSVAGIEDPSFLFLGFPPIRSKDRNIWLRRLAEAHQSVTTVFFEAPHRVIQTIDNIGNFVVSPIIVLRELTKVHEQILMGPVSSIRPALDPPRGEYTIVIPPAAASPTSARDVTDDELRLVFGQIAKTHPRASRREVIRKVSEQFQLPANRVYNATIGTSDQE
jgi:16S rRNA (cytidine1402-2'-O)-methyltransferase